MKQNGTNKQNKQQTRRGAQKAKGRALLASSDSKAQAQELRALAQRVSSTNGAQSRVGGVVANSIEDRAREEFRYVQGLVFPALSGPIPDLVTEPTSWTCFKETGQVTSSATGTVRIQVLPTIGDMLCTAGGGGTAVFGVPGVTGGCSQYTDAPAYRGLIDGVRCTALAVELKVIASSLVNQGTIAVGLTPVSPAAYLTSAQISRLPSQQSKGLPELVTESMHFYMEFGSFAGAAGNWRFLDFQAAGNAHSPSSPCINIALDGAAANTAVFLIKVSSAWEAVSTNRILPLSTPFTSNVAMEAASIVSHPAVRKLLRSKSERSSFATDAAKWIWDHRGAVTGASSEIMELAGRAAGAIAPLILSL